MPLVEILELRPSCGCTVAEMPKTPWVLAPGEKSSFRAIADFINSPEVQDVWAPAFGAARPLYVPIPE